MSNAATPALRYMRPIGAQRGFSGKEKHGPPRPPTLRWLERNGVVGRGRTAALGVVRGAAAALEAGATTAAASATAATTTTGAATWAAPAAFTAAGTTSAAAQEDDAVRDDVRGV